MVLSCTDTVKVVLLDWHDTIAEIYPASENKVDRKRHRASESKFLTGLVKQHGQHNHHDGQEPVGDHVRHWSVQRGCVGLAGSVGRPRNLSNIIIVRAVRMTVLRGIIVHF